MLENTSFKHFLDMALSRERTLKLLSNSSNSLYGLAFIVLASIAAQNLTGCRQIFHQDLAICD